MLVLRYHHFLLERLAGAIAKRTRFNVGFTKYCPDDRTRAKTEKNHKYFIEVLKQVQLVLAPCSAR